MKHYPITVELSRLLEALWGHREACYLSRDDSLVKELEREDLKASLFYHLQYEDDKGEQLFQVKLWRRTAWINDSQKVQLDRFNSECGRQERELTREQIKKLAEAISSKTFLSAEMCLPLAKSIYEGERRESVESYGITEKIVYPSEMAEYIKSLVTDLKSKGEV